MGYEKKDRWHHAGAPGLECMKEEWALTIKAGAFAAQQFLPLTIAQETLP